MNNIIAIEGADGAGKSTVVQVLVNMYGYRSVRDPGTGPASAKLREMLLTSPEPLSVDLTMALFLASNIAVMEEAQRLSDAGHVVMDRTYLSNMAYRMADGIPYAVLRMIYSSMMPGRVLGNRTFILDVPDEVREQRLAARGAPDKEEAKGMDRLRRIAGTYRTLSRLGHGVLIDAARSPEAIAADIHTRVSP